MFSRLRRLFRRSEPESATVGRRGEREAEKLLKRKGLTVLARNFRAGRDEIDLICLQGKTVIFIEVRTRRKGALVQGYDSINERKRAALQRVSRSFFAKMKPKPLTLRFDVIEVEHEDAVILECRHHENVPLFPKSLNRGV